MDLYGRPPTVLKTAGPASISVHGRPHRFDFRRPLSGVVRCRPLWYVHLAVFLAVIIGCQGTHLTPHPEGRLVPDRLGVELPDGSLATPTAKVVISYTATEKMV